MLASSRNVSIHFQFCNLHTLEYLILRCCVIFLLFSLWSHIDTHRCTAAGSFSFRWFLLFSFSLTLLLNGDDVVNLRVVELRRLLRLASSIAATSASSPLSPPSFSTLARRSANKSCWLFISLPHTLQKLALGSLRRPQRPHFGLDFCSSRCCRANSVSSRARSMSATRLKMPPVRRGASGAQRDVVVGDAASRASARRQTGRLCAHHKSALSVGGGTSGGATCAARFVAVAVVGGIVGRDAELRCSRLTMRRRRRALTCGQIGRRMRAGVTTTATRVIQRLSGARRRLVGARVALRRCHHCTLHKIFGIRRL
jgi:hypothetical protein